MEQSSIEQKVYIVTSDNDQASRLSSLLEQAEIHTVIADYNNDPAGLAEDFQGDLLLLSAKLPENGCLRILEHFRSPAPGVRDNLLSTPVIVLTASSDPEEEIQYLDAGATAVIPLSVDDAVFQARIRAFSHSQDTIRNVAKAFRQQSLIFQHSPVATLILDKSGTIIDLNKAAHRLFRVEPGEQYKRLCGEIFRCRHALENKSNCGGMEHCKSCIVRTTINEALHKNATVHTEGAMELVQEGQTHTRNIIVDGIPFQEEAGHELVLLTFNDVSEEKKAEALIKEQNYELQKAHDELSVHTAQLEEMTVELEAANDNLRQEEERYRTIFDGAAEGIAIADRESGHLISANKAFLQMFGYKHEEIEGLHFSRLHPPEYLQEAKFVDKDFKGLETGQSRILEFLPCVKKDGTKFHVYATDSRIKLNGQDCNAAFFNDATEQVRIQKKLEENEAKFHTIFDAAYDGILLGKVATKQFTLANEAMQQMLGYNPEEILGLTLADIHPREALPRISKTFEKQARGEVQILENAPTLRKDGSIFIADVNAAPLMIGDEQYIVGVFRDVTEKRQLEENRREAYARLTAIFENLNALIYVADMDTYEILFINKYGREIWGDIVGQTCWKNIQSGQTGPCDFCTNDELVDASGEPAGLYRWVFYNDLARKWYDCSDQAIRWTDGRLVRLEIALDISELKETQDELHQANETKDRFISILAHDLRNAFQSYMGFAQLLYLNTEDYSTDEIREMGEHLYSAATGTYSLLENLLKWAKNRQGSQSFAPDTYILNDLVQESLALFASSAKLKDISLKKDVPEAIEVFADHEMLLTIIRNLVSNSIKFTDSGGTITVRAFAGDSEVTVFVEDDGVGMDEETRQNLFELKDKKSRQGTEGESGSGLGLVLCRDFVHKHGGEISVESRPGTGSIFSFSLPNEQQH